jgi:hypothetical protein
LQTDGTSIAVQKYQERVGKLYVQNCPFLAPYSSCLSLAFFACFSALRRPITTDFLELFIINRNWSLKQIGTVSLEMADVFEQLEVQLGS